MADADLRDVVEEMRGRISRIHTVLVGDEYSPGWMRRIEGDLHDVRSSLDDMDDRLERIERRLESDLPPAVPAAHLPSPDAPEPHRFAMTDLSTWPSLITSSGWGGLLGLILSGGIAVAVARASGCDEWLHVGGTVTLSTDAKPPLPPQPVSDGAPPVDCETVDCKIEALRRAAEAVEGIYDSAGVLDAR